MSAHQNRHASQESAAASPLARYLRNKAGVGNLRTFYSEDIGRDMNYSAAHRREIVISSLKELKELRVIDYVAEKGRNASILIRVLI